jgi:hypothetical protein
LLNAEESLKLSNTLHRIFLFLYLQFAFYWATIAAGMFVNYYYVVPNTLAPNAIDIFAQFLAAPSLFAHVAFAVLSTSMSIPVIILARRVRLSRVILLHLGAISARTIGFIAGPLFMYFSTSAIANSSLANISTFLMASVFLLAVILTFLSRIFIVREDVRIKFSTTSMIPQVVGQGGTSSGEMDEVSAMTKGEELGNLGLAGLKLTLQLCYANFIVYLLMYVTGMYVNIFITSGVNTIGIGDIFNIIHMVTAILNFAFSFIVMMVGFVYGMRKVGLFSLGAVISLAVGTVGGILFLATGGGRGSGTLTLEGGWLMSILFMLAIFLSYYATLKVMRAIRVIEAVKSIEVRTQ